MVTVPMRQGKVQTGRPRCGFMYAVIWAPNKEDEEPGHCRGVCGWRSENDDGGWVCATGCGAFGRGYCSSDWADGEEPAGGLQACPWRPWRQATEAAPGPRFSLLESQSRQALQHPHPCSRPPSSAHAHWCTGLGRDWSSVAVKCSAADRSSLARLSAPFSSFCCPYPIYDAWKSQMEPKM